MHLNLGVYEGRVERRLETWQGSGFCRRLWSKDPTLWSSEPHQEIINRLGWLDLPEIMEGQIKDLIAFAGEIRSEGINHVVLLGMGGASLAPEVFWRTFGNIQGYPALIVLDSTHPDTIRAIETRLNLARTLFLVSSKSGTTTETISLFHYFWHRMEEVHQMPGWHFVAITDPGTPLEQLALERGFRRVFQAPPDVGGRYSALSVFGLLPAAMIGVDIGRILERAKGMANACVSSIPEQENPCLRLGAALGELAMAGRDKVTFIASIQLASLLLWLEQLVAESTGKDGKGIVPVADEPLSLPGVYGTDRLFVYLKLKGDEDARLEGQLAVLEAVGHPVAYIQLDEKADMGQEFFRWEVAVAVAGAVLGINPFNQPDVELTKDITRRLMTQGEKEGRGDSAVKVEGEGLTHELSSWLSNATPGDYVAIQAYLLPTSEITSLLQNLRMALRDRLRLATTIGYGPRFLHSTGQLHKGGPRKGLFLQLIDVPEKDIEVPSAGYTFGTLIHAQALGDFHALKQQGHRVLRVNLGSVVVQGLQRLLDTIQG
ncbi:MAG: hypothetical protein HY878_06305 [Deltaproteobacteria bacterium]|nr:hypothetical protein [Deltaproteobacteria bacterium]